MSSKKQFEGSTLAEIYFGVTDWPHELIGITPSNDHVVLFQLPLPSEKEFPKPRTANSKWDHEHVRLPCANENKMFRIDRDGNKLYTSRWEFIKRTLSRPIGSSQDLENAIKTYNINYASIWNFSALHDIFHKGSYKRLFFTGILPEIIKLALRLPELIQCPIPLLKKGMNKSISMSQQQIACLLANAFLCTFPRRNTSSPNAEYSNYPEINFNSLFSTNNRKGIQKLKCIFNYFERVLGFAMPSGIVTFERRFSDKYFDWKQCDVMLSSTKFHTNSTKRTEEARGMLQIDFTDDLGKRFSQKGIRSCINPEMIAAKLFTEFLGDGEVLTIVGAEQFNSYRGCAVGFKWTENSLDLETPSDSFRRKLNRVVLIDAFVNKNKVDETLITKELNNMLVGIQTIHETDKIPIASGPLGCGSLKRNYLRSALIQLMACSVTGRNIFISTFSNVKVRIELAQIFELLSLNQVTVEQLYEVLIKVSSNESKELKELIEIELHRKANK